MGSTSSEPAELRLRSPPGAVIDGGPCPRSHRPAVPCPAGTGWPEGLLQPGIKALGMRVGAPEPSSQAGSKIPQEGWGQPGAALPRSCPWFGRDLGCSRHRGCSHSHSLRLLPKALPKALPVWLTFPFPSLSALGFTYGVFYLLNVCAALCGQSPEGTGCRQSSRSVLTLPGPRRDRDPLTGQEPPAGWERRAKQSCLPLFQVLP